MKGDGVYVCTVEHLMKIRYQISNCTQYTITYYNIDIIYVY